LKYFENRKLFEQTADFNFEFLEEQLHERLVQHAVRWLLEDVQKGKKVETYKEISRFIKLGLFTKVLSRLTSHYITLFLS
jgi:hypothetical protein